MSDIVERLRYCGKELADHYSHAAIFEEAADEIERLRAQILKIEGHYVEVRSDALEEAAKAVEEWCGDEDDLKLELGNVIRAMKEREPKSEPVAWRCVAEDGVSDLTEDEEVADQWRSDGFAVTPLYAAPGSAEARNDALEEAAKVATSFLVGDPANGVPLRSPIAHEIADAIRALKEKEPA